MHSLKDAIEAIDAAVPDATRGLPEDVFYLVSRMTPMINVDLLIKNEAGATLLTWRADRYYGPGWHVPGGIVRFKERWEDRIAAVADGELKARVRFSATPVAVRQPMNPHRATRGHFISLLFPCTLETPPDERLRHSEGEPRNGAWAWHGRCPDDLIPQHAMYREFL